MIPIRRSRPAPAAAALFLLAVCPFTAPFGAPPRLAAQEDAPARISIVPSSQDIGKLPDHTSELAAMAASAFAKRDWNKAKLAYVEMLAADPDNALTLSNLGVVELQMNELDAARAHLEKAVLAQPKIAQSWITLGIVYHRQGDANLAISALTRALHEDPADARAHRYLAVVIRARGWLTGAEEELKRAIELNPKDAEAHFNLALMYLERADPAVELARRHYYTALDLGAAPDAEIAKQLAENR